RKNKTQVIKRTVKYLSVSPDQIIVRNILQKAPDGVIRAISNAALNARSGEVHVPPHIRSVFRRHNKHFDYLTDKRKPLKHKRRLLIQQGGALPIIVPLLATVFGSIGSEFIS
ncbi:hypothetical protein NL529_27430, partial [Klebsiella pneumoniae]|nr:hypothetical protein [Klebsiella pneumoniae]